MEPQRPRILVVGQQHPWDHILKTGLGERAVLVHASGREDARNLLDHVGTYPGDHPPFDGYVTSAVGYTSRTPEHVTGLREWLTELVRTANGKPVVLLTALDGEHAQEILGLVPPVTYVEKGSRQLPETLEELAQALGLPSRAPRSA